jgi:hypothetical protein
MYCNSEDLSPFVRVVQPLDFALRPSARRRSCLVEKVTQLLLHIWPLCRHDRIAYRIASNVVGGYPMGSENPFELAADAFQRSS